MQKLFEVLEPWGSRNVDYYVKAFDKLEKTGENTFNNAAAYLGCAWMLYRKMYLYAIIAFACQFALMYVLEFLGHEITSFGDTNRGQFIGIIISWLISIRLFGKYGNKLYYKVIKSRILENYHILDNYQATSFPLALSFVFGRLASPIFLSIPLLILYSYYVDSFSNFRKNFPKENENQVSSTAIKQYLNQNTPSSLLANKISGYLAYLLSVVSFGIGLFALMHGSRSLLEIGLAILFPILV